MIKSVRKVIPTVVISRHMDYEQEFYLVEVQLWRDREEKCLASSFEEAIDNLKLLYHMYW